MWVADTSHLMHVITHFFRPESLGYFFGLQIFEVEFKELNELV